MLGLALSSRRTPGVLYAEESTALFAAMSSQPTDERKLQIDALIVSMKSTGVWSLLDVFYMFASHDSQAARLNWKNPGTLTATVAAGSPTFTTDRGYTGDGTTAYISTGYDPGVSSLGMAQNSAHVGAVGLTSTSNANLDVTSFNLSRMGVRVRSGTAGAGPSIRVTVGITSSLTTGGNVPHHIVGVRVDSANQRGYRNGSFDSTFAVASSAVPGDIRILGDATLFTDRQIACVHVGQGLTDQNVADCYSAINTYLSAVGAV